MVNKLLKPPSEPQHTSSSYPIISWKTLAAARNVAVVDLVSNRFYIETYEWNLLPSMSSSQSTDTSLVVSWYCQSLFDESSKWICNGRVTSTSPSSANSSPLWFALYWNRNWPSSGSSRLTRETPWPCDNADSRLALILDNFTHKHVHPQRNTWTSKSFFAVREPLTSTRSKHQPSGRLATTLIILVTTNSFQNKHIQHVSICEDRTTDFGKATKRISHQLCWKLNAMLAGVQPWMICVLVRLCLKNYT